VPGSRSNRASFPGGLHPVLAGVHLAGTLTTPAPQADPARAAADPLGAGRSAAQSRPLHSPPPAGAGPPPAGRTQSA